MKNTKLTIVITVLFASLWANVGVAQILQKLGNMAKQPLTKEELERKKEYTTLEEALKDGKQVFKLNLVDKNLTSLPDEFYELENLQVLDLSNNPQLNWAEVIPKLAKLNMLSELGLGTNNLKELPAAITIISRLYNLALPKNPELNYEQVLSVLKDCKKLEKLDIGTNTFKTLPKGLNQLKNLNLLILEGNIYLEDINEITNMPNLERLSIHQCISLKTLPTELGKAKNLSLIDMSGCAKLTDSLSATFNRLADLGKLRMLSIKGSAIKKIPDEIGKLRQLQVLDLDFNPIEEISEEICKLKLTMKELHISQEKLGMTRVKELMSCLLQCQIMYGSEKEDKTNKVTDFNNENTQKSNVGIFAVEQTKLENFYPKPIRIYDNSIKMLAFIDTVRFIAEVNEMSGFKVKKTLMVKALQKAFLSKPLSYPAGKYTIALEASSDGKKLAIIDYDKSFKVADVLTGRELFSADGFKGAKSTQYYTDIRFSKSGNLLALRLLKGGIKVYDLTTNAEIFSKADELKWNCFEFSPDEKNIAIAPEFDKKVFKETQTFTYLQIINLADGSIKQEWKGNEKWEATALSFRNEKNLFIGTAGGKIYFYDIENNKAQGSFQGYKQYPISVIETDKTNANDSYMVYISH